MYFMMPGASGTGYIPVKGTLLASYPIARSVDFFLLNEDRLSAQELLGFLLLRPLTRGLDIGFKWVDFAGFWLTILVLAGVCVHIILRIVVRK